MRLQDHIDFTTLQWVKPELDTTLSFAREALESFVDNPGNTEVMRTCASSLHQVLGTLRMVELYGAAMVAEEMETLVIALVEDHVEHREEAYAVLMRGLMQLPDYLERLSSGHRDVPIVLLPLLNELRASRGQPALPDSVMFNPNLETPLPPEAPVASNVADAELQRGQVAELRLRFQQQLLGWFRGQNPSQQLVGMRDTLLAIAGRCYSVPGRRLWWIAAGVLEGLEQGRLHTQAAEVRRLVGKVDRHIRQLIEHGEGSLRSSEADELSAKLLYIVAQSRQRSPQMELLRQTYRLDSLLPAAGELEHARGSMAGHNRALLDSVSRALKDDLLRVKEALDLFLRQSDADPSQLSAQSEVLERVGDTLGMLALSIPRRVINEQRHLLDEIVHRVRPAREDLLLDIAGALLYVEASLDDHIESLGADGDPAALGADAASTDNHGANPLPRSEARHILASLLAEAIGNTGRAKEAVVGFIESGWQHAQLNDVPALMDEVAGAMRMLSAGRPADLAEAVGRFVSDELLADGRVPGHQQMDHLADALAALDYYLEAAREHRGGLEHVLGVAEHSLEQLGYWPLPAARPQNLQAAPAPVVVPLPDMAPLNLTESISLSPGDDLTSLFMGTSEPVEPPAHELSDLHLVETVSLAEQADAADALAAAGADDGDWVEIEEEIFEQVRAVDALSTTAGFQLSTDGIDDDIREIFLEEMQEEIDNLVNGERAWLVDPQQLPALIPVRRSFHTLKGSGRLVGASVLGEFAWKVENMLNRVLDASIEPHAGVQALLREAIGALPQLLGALKDGTAVNAPLAAIMQTADRLALGDMAQISDFAPAATETVRRVVKRRVPRAMLDADSVPTAAHTDQTSVDAQPGEPEAPVFALPVMPPVDPVLLEILRSEVAQYLQAIRAALPEDDAELRVDDGLLRAVHTLHGAIAMVDIPLLTQLLSPLESLLKRLRAAGVPLSVEGVQLLGQTADIVDHVMTQFDVAEPQLPEMDALTRRLGELRDSQPEPQIAHVVFDPHVDDERDMASDAAATETDEPAAAESMAAGEATRLDQGPADESFADTDGASADAANAQAAAVSEVEADENADEDGADDSHESYAAQLLAALGEFDAQSAEPLSDELAGHAAQLRHEHDEPGLDLLLDSLLNEPLIEGVAEVVSIEHTSSDANPDAWSGIDLPIGFDTEAVDAGVTDAHVEAEAGEAEHAFGPGQAEPPVAMDAEAIAHDGSKDDAEIGTELESDEVAESDEAIDASGERVEANMTIDAEADVDAVEPTEIEELPDAGAETVMDSEAAIESDAEAGMVEPISVQEPVVAHDAHQPTEDQPVVAVSDLPEPAAPRDVEWVEAAVSALSDAATADSESVWSGQIDPDLLEIFTEEAGELLDHAGELLALWRAEPSELGHVASLQRDLHTLKGGARIAGLAPVGDLTHAVETLLGKPIGHGAGHAIGLISALEAGIDKLHSLVQGVAQGQPIAYPQAMIERFLALAGEEALVDNDEFTAPAPHSPMERIAAIAPAMPFGDELPELLPEQHEDARAPQEQIRVRAELLDNLVNHAGEVAIYRSRLEQQVAGYRFNLVELEQTVARLRSQLRMLEIETEAQIIARFQHEHRESGLAAFDPLELDRFSQLQQYSRALAESVSDLVSIQNMLDELTRQAETLLIQQSRVSSELQEGLLRTRMLPFDTMVPNLRRTLRQAAQEQGKSAQLYVEGAHGEMDRNLLDRIKAPFEHMLRNAIAHGIETPAERHKAGKPAEGAVRIRVAREATEVVIRVSDDGRGLDRDAISKRAIERGLLRADAKPSDDQLLALITQTGFSTAGTVTQLSGRGVGMDVVANEIKQLGGSLAIESRTGQGTTFVLRLPFTLAVTQAILVRIGEATFAIPMTSVQGVARISPEELAERMNSDEPSFPYSGEQYGIHDLAELLNLPLAHASDEAQLPLLLTRAGDLRAAIRIDAVLGSREIVVKSVGPQISSVPGLLGATIMGDGSVLIILDLAPLVRHGIARRQQRLAEGLSAVQVPLIEEIRTKPLVMVVDDSITMRKVTGRVLERHEYEVSTAKDGIDAIEKLHDRVPDMMLLDIEMPRMDGYELATHMKADPRLRDVPIIMITSRSGEKHRQRAFDIGVDRYLGKPYQEAELLAQIVEVLEQRREMAGA